MAGGDITRFRHGSHGCLMADWAVQAKRFVRRAGRRVLDFILPPLCLKCRSPVTEPQSVCGACWVKIRFLAPPQCIQCGLPFPHDLGSDVKCGACLARSPIFKLLRSAIAYDDASRDLILGFKHADKLENCPLFCRWMNVACKQALEGADVLLPVPLHWKRQLVRRYNQAALLAHGLGSLSGVPVQTAWLVRAKATLSQGEMISARARLKNVARAFTVVPAARQILQGKNVVLVDDVLTTGATVQACAKALFRCGVQSVSVVTLARVVRPLNFSA